MSLIALNETQENQFIDRVRIEIGMPLSYDLIGCLDRSKPANEGLERREMIERALFNCALLIVR